MKQMPPNKEFYRGEIEKSLQQPLKTLAAGKKLEVRQLVSQVLSDFVSRRQQLLLDIAKNNEIENKEH
jgi:hypothetical protein